MTMHALGMDIPPQLQELLTAMVALRSDVLAEGEQTPPTHPLRQWSLKLTGFPRLNPPLGIPHFST